MNLTEKQIDAREKPIIFSAPMVRAILEGRKTMTRRVVKAPLEWANPKTDGRMMYDLSRAWKDGKPESGEYLHVAFAHPGDGWQKNPKDDTFQRVYAPWDVGDRLWVREAWQVKGLAWGKSPKETKIAAKSAFHYKATDTGEWKEYWGKWRNPMFMPKWAARLWLEVTAVKVERLHEISEGDAICEGMKFLGGMADNFDEAPWADPGDKTEHPWRWARGAFCAAWKRINGEDSWAANPWCWCITFRVQPTGGSHE